MNRVMAFTRCGAAVGLILAVGLMASPAMAAPGDPPDIKNMKVSIWPEYDDPRIMVQYEGEFQDASVFPQGVNFPMPSGTEMNMVCALQPPNDEHLCQLYTVQAASDEVTVSYTLPIPTYYLEYYWDGVKGQSDKSFTFEYKSPYAIDRLELEVQQPLRATDFKPTEPYASVTTDSLGMKYYHYVYDDVSPGQVITVGAAYAKPDNKPSVAKQQASGGAGSGGITGTNYTVAIMGGALLAAAVIGFAILKRRPAPAPARAVAPGTQPAFRSRKVARAEARLVQAQRTQASEARRPQLNTQAQPSAGAGPQAGVVFCTQCGTRLFQGSLFCHTCGTKAKGVA